MAELKPCPFCGGEADCNNAGFLKNGKPMWAVECLNCGMVTAFFCTDSEAIEAWNKRTERPKGRWEDKNGNHVPFDERGGYCPVSSCYCSLCDEWLVGSDEYPANGAFCPNCGADMRGTDNDV